MAEYKAGTRQRAPTHPGRLLATVIADAGMNAATIAPLIGTSKMTLSRIMNEENPAPVSTDMALRLGKFFGNGPELWMGLQADYDIWHGREKIAGELAKIKPLPKSV